MRSLAARLSAGVVIAALLVRGAAASPAVDYVLHCQGCHRADGAATPGSGVPALAGSVGRFAAIDGGRDYLVRVPGVAQAPLDDEALAALLTWTLEHFSAAELSGDFTPFTAAEIARGRRAPLTDVEGARRALLDALERTPAHDGAPGPPKPR